MSLTPITYTAPNAEARMRGRALRQFVSSPVFQQILVALAVEVQTVLDAIKDLLSGRTLSNAEGVQLDVIGRIVGQGRVIPYYTINDIDWFTPDETGFDLDTAVVWVTNGLDGSDHTMSDAEYRDMIEAKIYRNQCKYGSPTEIMTYAQKALGIPISAVATVDGNIEIILPAGTPQWKVIWATRCFTDNRGSVIPIMPYPVTKLVTKITYI